MQENNVSAEVIRDLYRSRDRCGLVGMRDRGCHAISDLLVVFAKFGLSVLLIVLDRFPRVRYDPVILVSYILVKAKPSRWRSVLLRAFLFERIKRRKSLHR